MAVPEFWVKYAAADNPFTASPTWTDISDRLRSASWTRGRGSVVDEISAGTATIRLKNHDRALEPGFAAGPYNPIYPYRPMNIGATWASTDISLFYGFVESWNVIWDKSWDSAYSEVEVHLVDAIALLNGSTFSTSFPLAETAAVRIGKVLSASRIGFPLAMRQLSGGPIVKPLLTTDVSGALQESGIFVPISTKGPVYSSWAHIQDCVRTGSSGVCLVDRRGYFTYPGGSGAATFGDDPSTGELKYSASALNWGVDLVFNTIQVTADKGVKQEVSDLTSRTRYRERTHARTTLNTSDAAALTLATSLLAAYKDPKPRLEGFQVRPGNDSAIWTAVLSLDADGFITVKRRPPGGGTMFQQQHRVMGLNWQLDGYHPHNTTVGYTLHGTTTFA